MTARAQDRSRIARALGTAWQGPLLWYCVWALAWAVGFALLATCAGCTRELGGAPEAGQGPRAGVRRGVSSTSVVTLLRVHRAEPFDSGAAGTHDTWEPACSAVAVQGLTGTLLVTAAHCTPEAALGSEARYYAPNGLGQSRAILVARDAVHDLAVLEPREPAELAPLERTGVPSEGSPVLSVSSLYDARSVGVVVASLGQGFYETSQTIVYGWSGSPVLDAHGRVWAVVSKCPVLVGADTCMAGHAYVASLGAL